VLIDKEKTVRELIANQIAKWRANVPRYAAVLGGQLASDIYEQCASELESLLAQLTTPDKQKREFWQELYDWIFDHSAHPPGDPVVMTANFTCESMADDIAEMAAKHFAAQLTMPELPRVGWQPIETAPKDGTPVILFARCKTATASAPVIGWCINGEWIEECFAPNRPVGIVPSHWMPRPPLQRG